MRKPRQSMPFGPERAKHEAAYVRARNRARRFRGKWRVWRKWLHRQEYHWAVCQGYCKLGMGRE